MREESVQTEKPSHLMKITFLTLCHAMEKACYLMRVLTHFRPLRGVREKDERGSEELLFFHACLC